MKYVILNEDGSIYKLKSAPVKQIPTTLRIIKGVTIEQGQIEDYYSPDFENLVEKTDNPAILDKETLIADGTDLINISGLPNPTTITIVGPLSGEEEVTTGSTTFSTVIQGNYDIIISSYGYKTKRVTINAT